MRRRLLMTSALVIGLPLGCSRDEALSSGTAAGGSGGHAGQAAAGGHAGQGAAGGHAGQGAAGGQAGGPSSVTTIGHGDCQGSWSLLGPLEHEDDDWAAARLTPASYPFEVDRIIVSLIDRDVMATNGATCWAEIPTKAMVFKGIDVTPPANPDPVQEVSIAIESAPRRVAEYAFDLPKSMTLDEGEHLFVALQVQVDGDKITCIKWCEDAAPDSAFWASQAAPPFAWGLLASWGIAGRFAFKAQDLP